MEAFYDARNAGHLKVSHSAYHNVERRKLRAPWGNIVCSMGARSSYHGTLVFHLLPGLTVALNNASVAHGHPTSCQMKSTSGCK